MENIIAKSEGPSLAFRCFSTIFTGAFALGAAGLLYLVVVSLLK